MIQEAVIAVFCYKRAAKLKAAIEALLKNPECASMDIIFFADGFKGEKDKQHVLETRAYIDSISGFRNVIKHYRETNFSTGPNFETGLKFLAANYEQFIVVEDDLVVSSNYIKYMLDALEFYKTQQTVFCITGYVFPLELNNYTYDTVIYKRFCSYGWAGWADRVAKVEWKPEALSQMMNTSPNFKSRLNAEGMDLHRMLKKQLNGTISTWDVQMQVHVAEMRMKVVYPTLSKVKNIGFDNESTNTFGLDYLKTPLDSGTQRTFNFCPENVIVPQLERQIKKPYGLQALATRKIINTIIKVFSRVKKAG